MLRPGMLHCNNAIHSTRKSIGKPKPKTMSPTFLSISLVYSRNFEHFLLLCERETLQYRGNLQFLLSAHCTIPTTSYSYFEWMKILIRNSVVESVKIHFENRIQSGISSEPAFFPFSIARCMYSVYVCMSICRISYPFCAAHYFCGLVAPRWVKIFLIFGGFSPENPRSLHYLISIWIIYLAIRAYKHIFMG